MEQEVFGNYEALPNDTLRQIAAERGIPMPRAIRTTLLKNLNDLDKAIDISYIEAIKGLDNQERIFSTLRRLANQRGLTPDNGFGELEPRIEDLTDKHWRFEIGRSLDRDLEKPGIYNYAQRRYGDELRIPLTEGPAFQDYEQLSTPVLRRLMRERGITTIIGGRDAMIDSLRRFDQLFTQNFDALRDQSPYDVLATAQLLGIKIPDLRFTNPTEYHKEAALRNIDDYLAGRISRTYLEGDEGERRYNYFRRFYQTQPGQLTGRRQLRRLAIGEPFLETPPTRVQPPRQVKSPRQTRVNTPTRIEATPTRAVQRPRAAATIIPQAQEVPVQFIDEEIIIPTEVDIRKAKIAEIRDWLASFGLGHRGLRLKQDYVSRALDVRDLFLRLGNNGLITEEEWIAAVPDEFI